MSEQVENQKEKKKGGSKTKIIIGVAGVIIVVLVGIIVYLLKPEVEEKSTPQIVTPENVEQVMYEMENAEKVPVGAYEVKQNLEWIFVDGTSVSSNAYVENSTANTNMVYFDVKLRDTGEEVYMSPYLAIGAQLNAITLDKNLDKGTYDAVITYHLVDDDFNDLSQVSMTMRIVVEN